MAILRKDLIRELRTREMIISMILFVLLAMVIFHYAFSVKEGADLTYFTGGMLWVTFIFAMLLGLNRSFAQEKDERCLDGLLLCPVDRVTIFLAKTAGNLIFLLIIQVVAVPGLHAVLRRAQLRSATSCRSSSFCCSPTWASAPWARCSRRSP